MPRDTSTDSNLFQVKGTSMKKPLVEFIGTFFLVSTVGNTVLDPGSVGDLAPIAIGAILMTMIFAGGHISGGHYNPAVTLAVLLRGKCPLKEAITYWAAQIFAALVAAAVVLFLKGYPPAPAPVEFHPARALVAEFIGTFALAFVVLNVATAKGTEGNSFYGLAIGFTVLAQAFAVGPISGGAFNPAVATGISTLGLVSWTNFWVYLIGDLGGSALAALAFFYTNPKPD
jgi:aquaporin Z